jgi:hypothetical protein
MMKERNVTITVIEGTPLTWVAWDADGNQLQSSTVSGDELSKWAFDEYHANRVVHDYNLRLNRWT